MIFTPFQKRYAILSGEDKKTINEFIMKVDPRAPKASRKRQNIKALVLKQCQ